VSKVSYLVELTINEGKLEAFKEFAESASRTVHDGEPGTLDYQWRIGEDGTRCLLTEGFESSEALLIHLGNIGPILPDLLELAPITRFEVMGSVNDEARAALDGLGAKHFPNFAGFTR